MAWSDSDLLALGYDPRSGKRLVQNHPNPVAGGGVEGRKQRREARNERADDLPSNRPELTLGGAHAAARGPLAGRGNASRPVKSWQAGESPAPLSASARSRLQPEQLLQVEVIEQLRPRLVLGAKLCALNGELPGGTSLFRMWQSIRKAMGYEPGTPDLCAFGAGRTCFIELKRPRAEADLLGHRKARGELSSPQRLWRNWAQEQGYDWIVARSVADVESALIRWQMI